MFARRMLLLRTLLCSGSLIVAFAAALDGEAQAKKVSFDQIRIEGKVLRQQPKGKACKVEIDVHLANIQSEDPRAVRARLVLLQPCVKGLKVGTRASGVLNCSRLRASTRTTNSGTHILEFSARVHGRLVGEIGVSASENLVADTATASGRLIGDADASPPK